MARKLLTYVYPGYLNGLAQKLGNAPWNQQVRIMGTFPSRKSFIEAAAAAELIAARAKLAAARYMTAYGYVYEPRESDGPMEPGVIYVQGDLSHEKPVRYSDVKDGA